MSQDAINYKNFFNTISDFLFILDMEGNILDLNDAVINTLGYDRDDLAGKSILTVHPPIFRERAAAVVKAMIEGKTKFCRIPLISKTNSHFLVETKVYHTEWNSQSALLGVSRNLLDVPLTEGIFQEVFDNSPVLTVISELDTGMIIYANKPFVSTLGYKQAETVGKRFEDLQIFHDYYQKLEIKRKIEKHENIRYENVAFQKRNGELLYCIFTASKVEIQSHTYLFMFLENITELKNAESRLRHNLRQQTLLADISKSLQTTQNLNRTINQILKLLGEHTGVSRVYIFEDDPTGTVCNNTYEWCNKGISPQINELQGIPYEMIPSWKEILSKEGRVFSTNIKELPPDLTVILEPQGIKSLLIYPLYVNKKFFGFIGFDECTVNKTWETDELELLRTIANFLSNTYERIKIQQQLADSEAQLKMAIQNTETGLWDWNIVTGEGYFNDTWCSMLGYSREEVEAHVSSWENLIHPEDKPRIQEELDKHLRGETETYESAHRLLTKSGKWKWIMDRGRIIERDAEGNPLRAIGTHTDIDGLKEIENEFRIANAASNKIYSSISRELRAPLNALIRVTELNNGNQQLRLGTIKSLLKPLQDISGTRLVMLNNMLTWAELSSGNFRPEIKTFFLNEIISEILSYYKERAALKGILFTTELSHAFAIKADVDLLQTVLRNLLSNAIKFTPREGQVKMKVSLLNKKVKIEVSDNGIGIAPEKLESIFAPGIFYSTPGTDGEDGEGLGLKLCKELISLMGGTWDISSVINNGTQFVFILDEAD